MQIEAKDGTRLRGAHFGNDDDMLVVVAHGVTASMRHPEMVRVIEELSSEYDVLAFDFRGHGKSGGSFDLDFNRSAQDVEAAVG